MIIKKIEKINETKSYFFKDKQSRQTFAGLRKKERRLKIKNKKGDMTADGTEILRIISNYYEQIYTTKFDKL